MPPRRPLRRRAFPALAVLAAALLPAACREPPPPLPEPLARFSPENLPPEPDDYPSLGRVPDRPADLPTPAEREVLRQQLEEDRAALRTRRSNLPPEPEAEGAIGPPGEPPAASPRPPSGVPGPAGGDSVTP
jgi:hypothetical protein